MTPFALAFRPRTALSLTTRMFKPNKLQPPASKRGSP